ARVSMNITGRFLSISAAMWRSTAESAPKLETSAIRPLNSFSIAARITVRGSTPAKVAESRPAPSELPNKAASRDAIKSLLEWRHADSPVSGKKILLGALPQLQIGIDKRFDRADDVVGRKTAAGDGADGATYVGRAAERNLIGLGPGFLETENSDVTDMVMSTGIDAAGDIYFELPDLPRAGRIAKRLRDSLGDGDRAGGRKRAIIEARAGDDIGHEACVRGGKTLRDKLVENFGQIIECDMRQYQILLMRDAQLVL